MKLRRLLFYIILLIKFVNAQNSLSGYVKNSADQQPLVNVDIFVTELQKGTISDSEGYYELSNLPDGNLHLQFRILGYKTVVKEIMLTQKKNVFNISLDPVSIELNEVVVIGSSVKEIENVPYKVVAISSEELNTSGFVNLTNSLTVLPGISSLSNGIAISKPVIRGMYGYRIVELVDGLKFDNQEWQNEHGFGMDDIGIGSVQIIQGPASLLYGSNAIGGVLNLVDPRNAPVGRTIGEYNLSIYSNTLGAKTSFGIKNAGANWSWQFYGGGESDADYSSGKGIRVPNTRFTGLSAKGILGYTSAWGLLNLEYSFSHHLFGVVEPNNVDQPEMEERFEREFDGPHHIVDFHIVSLKNLFFAGDSKFKLNVGFQNNHRVEDEGNENQGVNEEIKDMGELDVILNTISLDGAWIYTFENTELTLGTQGYIKSNENDGGRILVPNADMNEISGYFYFKRNFGLLNLEGGVRYDNNKITTKEMGIKDSIGYMEPLDLAYNTVNGALGGVVTINRNWNFKLNFATGFRTPNLAELSSNGVHEGTVRYELGNPNSLIEKNFQIDAGIIFQSSDAMISISLFDNQVKNFIYLNPTQNYNNGYQVYEFIQENSSLIGGEAYADIKLSKLIDISGSYSTVTGKTKDGDYLPFMPADKITASIKFQFNNWGSLRNVSFGLGTRAYLKQTKISSEEIETPGYILVDANLGTSINWGNQPINLSLSAANLLDNYYVSHLSLLRLLGLGDVGINIALSINLPLNFN